MGSWQCEEGCCRTRDACGIRLNRWLYWLPCTSWIIYRTGKRMTSLNDVLRNTYWNSRNYIWEVTIFYNSLKLSDTPLINLRKCFESIPIHIHSSYLTHLWNIYCKPWVMRHGSWLMTHHARVTSTPIHSSMDMWLNRLWQTFENMSAVLSL